MKIKESRKTYREQNANKITEYRERNENRKKEWNKQYYANNKDNINHNHVCEICNGNYRTWDKSTHMKTRLHLEAVDRERARVAIEVRNG